jgi:hypothetical protein
MVNYLRSNPYDADLVSGGIDYKGYFEKVSTMSCHKLVGDF